MRSVLALFFSWLMPSTGRRRAATDTVSTQPASTPADSPTTRLLITREALSLGRPTPPERVSRRPRQPEVLRGEDVALIRPYLILHECRHGLFVDAEATA